MGDWRSLPKDILETVAQRLYHVIDYVRFGAVCVAWRYVALRNHVHLPSQIPVLMIPSNNQEDEETRRFYSITERKVYNFQLQVPLKSQCRGSEYGWLVTVDKSSVIRLLNPFSKDKKEIQLPPLVEPRTAREFSLYKAILSSNPSSTLDFLVLAIFCDPDSDLAVFRAGDKAWTRIEWRGLLGSIHDAQFYNQKLYLVDGYGKVHACDVAHPHRLSLTQVSSLPMGEGACDQRYLVESLGELLQVQRIIDCCKNYWIIRTFRFNVYKFNFNEGRWVDVKSLGDQMLFLGGNTSLSISASYFPGCKPNCIYFTDESYHINGGAYDFGVFNLEDGSIEPLYPMDSNTINPPPIWVQPPRLCFNSTMK